MTDATEAASAPAAPEVKETAPVEQQSTDQAAAEPQSAEQADKPEVATPEKPGEEPADEAAKKKSKGGFQKRIDELTREKFESQAQLDQLRREVEELRKTSKPSDPGQEPMPENFTTIPDWMKAHKEWAEKLGEQKGYEKATQETEKQRQERETSQLRATIAAREAAARQKHADYDAVIHPFGKVLMSHPAINAFVAESDTGPEVAYHLSKNPVVLDEIMRMTPYQAGRELLKLEAKLTAPAPAKPVTKAPDPIKTVGANEKVQKSPTEMSMDEYSRWRKDQRRKTKG